MTEYQLEIYKYIREQYVIHRKTPSIEQIANVFNRPNGAIKQTLKLIEKRKFIKLNGNEIEFLK